MLRALLIDDEADARADLRLSLAAHPAEVEIADEAETLDAAEAALARPDYDLVFLDVQLRGGTGFDLVPRIRPEARIIFVTAFDAHALRAFEANALDYLLKPIAPERLAAAIQRAKVAKAQAGEPADDGADIALRPTDVVYLRTGVKGHFVALHEICLIEAEQNYSTARLVDGSRLLLRRTMKSWEDVLPATHFMRVHRTAIVNLARVTNYERDREERTLLTIEGVKESIPATRKLWPAMQEKFLHLRRAI